MHYKKSVHIQGPFLPESQLTAAHRHIRNQVRKALKEKPAPLFIFEEIIVPAASIWSMSRNWIECLRQAGLTPGMLVAAEARPCPAFIALFVASLHEGYWLLPYPAKAKFNSPIQPACIIDFSRPGGVSALTGPESMNDLTGPQKIFPGGGLVLTTSGSTGQPACFGISFRNLLAVLESHLPLMANLENSRSWSMLPLHHAFALVIDLLPALLKGEAVYFASDSARSATAAADRIRRFRIDRLCTVPGWLAQVAEQAPDVLGQLKAGIVGGAPCSARLAKTLSTTGLQAGYGLTEASPGVALGKPGEWREGILGRAVGCQIRLAPSGELLFSGPNAADWAWTESGPVRLDRQRWVPTGDCVEPSTADDLLVFRGRTRAAFKLDNGRWIHPESIENRIVERFPDIREALLYSPDSHALGLCLLTDGNGPGRESIQPLLEGLGSRLERVDYLSDSEWPRSQKGQVLRHSVIQRTTSSDPQSRPN